MEVYANAKLLSAEKRTFKGSEGETVEYFVNFLKGVEENSSVIEVNSKTDFTAMEGKVGVMRIRVYPKDTLAKLSLVGIVPDQTFDTPEETIE